MHSVQSAPVQANIGRIQCGEQNKERLKKKLVTTHVTSMPIYQAFSHSYLHGCIIKDTNLEVYTLVLQRN